MNAAELAQCIAEVWIEAGPCGVTYTSVVDKAGTSRGQVSNHFPTSESLLRAGATHIVADHFHGAVSARTEHNIRNRTAQPKQIAVSEAYCWLARNDR